MRYGSLAAHTVVGGIYVRLLLEGADTGAPIAGTPSVHQQFLCYHV